MYIYNEKCIYLIPVKVPLTWEEVDVTPVRGLDGKIQIPQSAIESVNTNKVGLKGKLMFEVMFGNCSFSHEIEGRKYYMDEVYAC